MHFKILPLIALAAALVAAEGVPPVTANATPMGPGRPAMIPGRGPAGIEVELVVLKGAEDQAGLTRWAECSASGFRVSHVVADSGSYLLFLERTHLTTPNSTPTLRLPQALDADPAKADALRARLLADIVSRQAHPAPRQAPPAPPAVEAAPAPAK